MNAALQERVMFCGACMEGGVTDPVSFGCASFHTFCIPCAIRWAGSKKMEVSCPNCRDASVSLIFCPIFATGASDDPTNTVTEKDEILDFRTWKQVQYVCAIGHELFPSDFPDEAVGSSISKKQLVLLALNWRSFAKYKSRKNKTAKAKFGQKYLDVRSNAMYPTVINTAQSNEKIYAVAAKEVLDAKKNPAEILEKCFVAAVAVHLDRMLE